VRAKKDKEKDAAVAEERVMSGNHVTVPTGAALRVKALEAILEEKGLIDAAGLDQIVEMFEKKVGPRNGARVVAKAWADLSFRARLLQDATSAVAELGMAGPRVVIW
jgi:nitrile hydratase subunit alpha